MHHHKLDHHSDIYCSQRDRATVSIWDSRISYMHVMCYIIYDRVVHANSVHGVYTVHVAHVAHVARSLDELPCSHKLWLTMLVSSRRHSPYWPVEKAHILISLNRIAESAVQRALYYIITGSAFSGQPIDDRTVFISQVQIVLFDQAKLISPFR